MLGPPGHQPRGFLQPQEPEHDGVSSTHGCTFMIATSQTVAADPAVIRKERGKKFAAEETHLGIARGDYRQGGSGVTEKKHSASRKMGGGERARDGVGGRGSCGPAGFFRMSRPRRQAEQGTITIAHKRAFLRFGMDHTRNKGNDNKRENEKGFTGGNAAEGRAPTMRNTERTHKEKNLRGKSHHSVRRVSLEDLEAL